MSVAVSVRQKVSEYGRKNIMTNEKLLVDQEKPIVYICDGCGKALPPDNFSHSCIKYLKWRIETLQVDLNDFRVQIRKQITELKEKTNES